MGYVGWATLGGYGPFSGMYGLGADQIEGARLVDARGELIDADEELLKGIRGGGGIFGVIVELTVKVYPLKEVSEVKWRVPRTYKKVSRMTAYIPTGVGVCLHTSHPIISVLANGEAG